MFNTLQGEIIYIWYYFDIQLRHIFMYWVLGMIIGSLGIFLASALGIRWH